jgi:hypothetical protein
MKQEVAKKPVENKKREKRQRNISSASKNKDGVLDPPSR